MRVVIHKGLTMEHWFKFSLFMQLANVGCDVSRIIRARKEGDEELAMLAFWRALELLDLTRADPKHKGPRLKELGRVRETMIDYFLCDNQYGSTDEQWENYFWDYSYAASLERRR